MLTRSVVLILVLAVLAMFVIDQGNAFNFDDSCCDIVGLHFSVSLGWLRWSPLGWRLRGGRRWGGGYEGGRRWGGYGRGGWGGYGRGGWNGGWGW